MADAKKAGSARNARMVDTPSNVSLWNQDSST
jgi:hypothetical protein